MLRTVLAATAPALALSAPVEVLDGYWIDVESNPEDDTKVRFSLTLPKDSWMGLSLGVQSMIGGTDIIQCETGADMQCYDKVTLGFFSPRLDPEQNIDFTWAETADGSIAFTIDRLLETTDDTDYIFMLDTDTTIGYAINQSSSVPTQKHDTTGGIQVTLSKTVAEEETEMTEDEPQVMSGVRNKVRAALAFLTF